MKILNKIKYKLKSIFIHTPTREENLHRVITELFTVKIELAGLIPDEYKVTFMLKSFISGGCIYSLYNGTKPKDYDFFLKNERFANELRSYFIQRCSYRGDKMSGGTYNGLPLVVSDNAISLGKYQIITRWVGQPKDVVSQFDFLHNCYYFDNGKISALDDDFSHLENKELVYNEKRARDIVGTICRIPKFLQRGMTIKQKEVGKMLLKLHEVGFNERELEVLRDTQNDNHFGS